MSLLRRYLKRHVDRALAFEQHVTDALDLFDFDDDTSEPLAANDVCDRPDCQLCQDGPPPPSLYDLAFMHAYRIAP